jgi:exopolysaccharide biosynthesis polyprenyl glycosylphosphotransferase
LAIIILTDLMIFVGGVLAAYWIRFHPLVLRVFPPRGGSQPILFGKYALLSLYAGSLGALVFERFGFYRRRYGLDRRVHAVSLFSAVLVVYVFLMAWLFLYVHWEYAYSRGVVLLSLGLTGAGLAGAHALLKLGQVILMDRGIGFERTVVVALEETCDDICDRLRESHGSMHHVVGFIGLTPTGLSDIEGTPVLGSLQDLRAALKGRVLDKVILALPQIYHREALRAFRFCRLAGLDVRMVSDLFESVAQNRDIAQLGRVPTISLGDTPMTGPRIWAKNIFDRVLAGVVFIISAIPMAAIAILIKLDSRGSVLYRQRRVGADGRVFTMLKFRTMGDDAERDTGPVFAVENDPRCTRLGRWLRRYNLDEIPQVLNVLVGDMSLVGPRPERPYFVDKFKCEIPRYMQRHTVKSGITGLAQVAGLRGNTSVEKRTHYDLYYIKNWSLALDFKILLRTLRATRNAY